MFEYISQSGEYASEYNKKKEVLLKAKEDTQFLFKKKKSAAAERKQISKETAEVNSVRAAVALSHQSVDTLLTFLIFFFF